MSITRSARGVRLVAACALLAGAPLGCLPLEHYHYTPPVDAELTHHPHWGGTATLRHPAVVVGVMPHDRRGELFLVPNPIPLPLGPEAPFGVSLVLDPQQPDLSFQPRAVRLQVGDELPIAPEGYTRQCVPADGSRAPMAFCAIRPDAPRESATEPVDVPRYCCFALWFAVDPPEPGTPFRLSLSGLTQNGTPLAVGPVRFAGEESGWEQGRDLQ